MYYKTLLLKLAQDWHYLGGVGNAESQASWQNQVLVAEPEPAFCQDPRKFLCAFRSDEQWHNALGSADITSRCGHSFSWGKEP